MDFRWTKQAWRVVGHSAKHQISVGRLLLVLTAVVTLVPMLVFGLGFVFSFNHGLKVGIWLGAEEAVSAEATCPVLSTSTIDQIIGGTPVTALSGANTCVFTQDGFIMTSVSWRPDPQGDLFAESLRAVTARTFHIGNAVVAAPLSKKAGVYFDKQGNLVTVVEYDLSLTGQQVNALASAVTFP